MGTPIVLDTLSIEEKLQIMESLWDDLCQQPQNIEVPHWHQQLLTHRESAVKQASEQLIDWQDAKAQIRKQLA